MATVALLLAVITASVALVWFVRRSLWFRRREYRRLRSRASIEAKIQSATERVAARLPSTTIVISIVRAAHPPQTFSVGRVSPRVAPAECVFELGSITKLFTALALARLHGSGKVSLDARVVEIAPDWFPNANAWESVTLRDLATHTSGLPRLPPDLLAGDATLADPYRAFNHPALRAALASTPPSRRRHGRYRYSNYGYGLLGELLAQATGTSYQTLIVDTVIAPLGLRDTTFPGDPHVAPRLVAGRRRSGREVPNWHFDSMAGAGALLGSARDLGVFLSSILRPAEAWRATMPLLFAPTVRIDRRHRVGLAWHCVHDRILETEVWWHNGATGGYRAFVAFVPRDDIGIVVLSNSSPFDLFSPSLDRLGFDVLRYSARLDAF